MENPRLFIICLYAETVYIPLVSFSSSAPPVLLLKDN